MKRVRYPLMQSRMVRLGLPGLVATCASAVLLAACGGNTSSSALTAATTKPLTCDDSMKAAFKPDANTTVTLVKAFKKGDDMLSVERHGVGCQGGERRVSGEAECRSGKSGAGWRTVDVRWHWHRSVAAVARQLE